LSRHPLVNTMSKLLNDTFSGVYNYLYSFNDIVDILDNFMIPNSDYCPSHLTQFEVGKSISINIPFQFVFPKTGIGDWLCIVVWTSMPKTAVDENRNLYADESNIGCSGESRMKSVTIALIPQSLPQQYLRPRVLVSNTCHLFRFC